MIAKSLSAAALLTVCVVFVIADEPVTPSATEQPPALPAESSPTTQKIQQALRGESVETGDGILDDMLDVLKKRGSILDGSSLDSELAGDTESAQTSVAAGSSKAKQARVCESLLKSARLMEKLGKLSAEQRDLVAQMRQQAGQLLTASNKTAPIESRSE